MHSKHRPQALLELARFTLLTTLAPALVHAQQAGQGDWSGGAEVGTSLEWKATFESASNTSWRSIPGQAALSSSWKTTLGTQLVGLANLAFAIHGADIDGDGDQDVVGTAEGDGQVILWENDGGVPPTWTQHLVDANLPSAQALISADFDLDGRVDLVVSAIAPVNDLVWYHNEGGQPPTWTKQVIDPAFNTSYELAIADVNQDGRPDVMACSSFAKSVLWFENVPGPLPTFVGHVVDDDFDGAHCAKSADVDGDGDMDVVAVAQTANELAWYRNDGGQPTTWTKFVIRSGWRGGRSLEIADIDDDGDQDVVSVSWTSHLSVFENDGAPMPGWTEQVLASQFSGGHHVRVADVTGDGRLDVLAVAYSNQDVVCYENLGGNPVSFTKHFIHSNYPMPLEVDAADLDGDGDLDVMAASWAANGRFRWWSTTDFLPSGDLTSQVLDTGSGMPNAKLDWTAAVPTDTGLGFQVRSGASAGGLGAWSAEVTSPTLLGNLGRFVQYRALFTSANVDASPILESVSLSTPSTTLRNGSGTNPVVHAALNLPILGSTWLLQVDASALGATGGSIVVGSAAPLATPLPLGIGELLIDLSSQRLFLRSVPLVGGIGALSLALPNDPALVGYPFTTQTFLTNVQGSGALSNAVDGVAGY